jgi:hypothetical protein
MNSKGYVYFIKCDKWFKIGSTMDVYSRFHTVQVCNPYPVELFHKLKSDNMRLTEKLFQDMFGRAEKRGEWYILTPENLRYIKSGKYSRKIMESIGGASKPVTLPDLLPA